MGPVGAWEHIEKHGFRTAEQLIMEADVSEEQRQELLTTPRPESVHLNVRGEDVVLRDQGPLLARKDVKTLLDKGLDVSDWIQVLNRRVYFFTDETSMKKFLDKYVQTDGAQDVIWLSPLKVLDAAGSHLELTSQNTGAGARRSGE